MNKYIFKFTFSICFLLLFIQLGCGLLDSDDPKIERVNAVEKIFTLEDFTSSGFKKLKKYKVKDLPGATAAFYGFYKFEDPADYELRFYNTHEDALELGLVIAEERVGSKPEDVILDKKLATWKEGLKEARFCTGPTSGATSKGGTVIGAGGMGGVCTFPKYKDLIVYGNVIVLCQGNEKSESKENCINLIKKLEEK